MADPKRIIYRYNGNARNQEVVEDLFDEVILPRRGNVVLRKGKKWAVVSVMTESTCQALPTAWIFLTEKR
jgi:hypothetical protein